MYVEGVNVFLLGVFVVGIYVMCNVGCNKGGWILLILFIISGIDFRFGFGE